MKVVLVIRATAGPSGTLVQTGKRTSLLPGGCSPVPEHAFGKQNVGWISVPLSLSAGFPCAVPGAKFSVSRGWVLRAIRFHYTPVGAADAVGAWLRSLSHRRSPAALVSAFCVSEYSFLQAPVSLSLRPFSSFQSMLDKTGINAQADFG